MISVNAQKAREKVTRDRKQMDDQGYQNFDEHNQGVTSPLLDFESTRRSPNRRVVDFQTF